MKRLLALFLLCSLGSAAAMFAAEAAPTTYQHVAKSRMLGDMTLRVQRDGARALVQMTSNSDPKQLNIQNFYDFTAHRVYTLDLNSNLCTTVAYTSPYPPPLNDVVAMAGDMGKQLAASKAQGKPGEAIAGQPTQVYEVNAPEIAMKIWVDQKYSIPMRQVMTRKGEQPMTVLEVSELKFTAPPAGTFTFPTHCQKLEGTTDANGGHVSSH